MPILMHNPHDDPYETLSSRSAFLYTAVLAIASRFAVRHAVNDPGLAMAQQTPSNIRALAYAHLSTTLVTRNFALEDAQAILLLVGWALQGGGRGPDAWILLGHCLRLLLRLGVPLVVKRATVLEKQAVLEESHKLSYARMMLRWRAYLTMFQ
jgi:hypothetical protein